MLDLNVEAESTGSACYDETEQKTAIVYDSAATTPTASGGAEEQYSNRSSRADSLPLTLNLFSFPNKNDDDNDDVVQIEGDRGGFVTRQLFPVAGESSVVSAWVASRPQQQQQHWLNLAVPEPEGTAELGLQKPQMQPTPVKKSRRGPRSRSSQYRGVTFYRRTGRWESHIWDCGKQVYLGGFDTAHAAARAYDRAAIKFRGVDADINFHISDYEEDMKQTTNLTKEEFVRVLRRRSTGFPRGSSKYRGATLHKYGRWEARMGQFLQNKAYDLAPIKGNGREAVTKFERSTYQGEIIMTVKDGGNGEKIDLNLRVSPPSAAPGTDNLKNTHFQCVASEMPNGKILKVESSSTALAPHGLRMASNFPPTWTTTMYSGLTPNNEERATGRKAEALHCSGFSNKTWKVLSHGMVNPVPFFPSAASSGFSSTTVPFTNSLLPFIPNKPTHKPTFQQPRATRNYNLNNSNLTEPSLRKTFDKRL